MSANKMHALTLAQNAASRLSIRMGSTFVVTQGFDASGNPQITINDGTPATTEQNFYVRFIEAPSIGTNSIGQTQDSYNPTVVQLAMETSTVANLGFPTDANRLQVFGELLRLGARLEVYLETNGTVPTVTSIAAGNLKGTFDDLYFPFTGT